MGGMKSMVPTLYKNNIVAPKVKTPEEGKKLSNALDSKLEENAKGGNKAAAALLVKRRGRKKTILTSSTGLKDDESKITKQTLLGG
mgnify:CR=1 FL=1